MDEMEGIWSMGASRMSRKATLTDDVGVVLVAGGEGVGAGMEVKSSCIGSIGVWIVAD